MSELQPVEMADDEIAAFVGDRGTGVLALPADERPYAIPVSYAFDGTDREFLLRLGHLDDSEKDRHLDDHAAARLIVYDEEPLRSVIADGTLVELPKSELSPETIHTLGEGETPAFELWEEDKQELEVTIHRLEDTEVTGRQPREEP